MAKAKPKFEPKVHVRMYRQGLGDCFLLRFETGPKSYFDMLIDCGVYMFSPDAAAVMNAVVDDIAATTKDAAHPHGHLDLLVITHEHWDHISGFAQALPKFQAMAIDEVWQAWTEDETEPVAKELLEKYRKAKARLVGAMRGLAKNPGANAAALDEAFEIMAFFGVGKKRDEEDSYRDIKEMLAEKQNLRYLSPKQVVKLGNTGAKAFVLGPPKDATRIAKDDPGAKHGYHKQKAAFFEGFGTVVGAVESSLTETDMDRTGRPFGARLEVPVELARNIEFYQTHYGFEDDPEHPNGYRSIDDLAAQSLGQLALRLDSHLNNTSLVLALQLPSGEVLLFPGDAQAGNWLSWADLEAPLKFEKEKIDAHELLANTVFYKVSHHGSHNATPKTYGLELMTNPKLRAAVPVDGVVAKKARYGEMPLVEILDALELRTRGNVVRSDDAPKAGAAKEKAGLFRDSAKKLKVVQVAGGAAVERPLWCETSFDLG